MKFYTSVCRYGNKILYRGYENGQRIEERIPFSPTLFVESAKASGQYKTLYGVPCEPIEMGSMSEAQDFVKQYRDIPNFKVHGIPTLSRSSCLIDSPMMLNLIQPWSTFY